MLDSINDFDLQLVHLGRLQNLEHSRDDLRLDQLVIHLREDVLHS